LGVKAFECRRVKNDERDATDLADLSRLRWAAVESVESVPKTSVIGANGAATSRR